MDGVFPDVRALRIPVKYLANLLTAGDGAPVVHALERMIAMRMFMRAKMSRALGITASFDKVGLDEAMVDEMYRVMALAI